jgi:hypothetical protein
MRDAVHVDAVDAARMRTAASSRLDEAMRRATIVRDSGRR